VVERSQTHSYNIRLLSFDEFNFFCNDRFKQSAADEDALLSFLLGHVPREHFYHSALVRKYERLERSGSTLIPKRKLSKFLLGLGKDIRAADQHAKVAAIYLWNLMLD
jgi:hypothetical protein